jgi:glycerophosphoryl diester phosphodiesterase
MSLTATHADFDRLSLPYPNKGIIGHRGLAALAPENTQVGFIAAAQAGLSWVEFDIQRCATGEWVVFHDETLERTSNGQGLLRDKTNAELKQLDIGSWFDPRFAGEHLLSLNEVLPLLASLGLHPNIEVKFFKDAAAENKALAAKDLGQQIQQYWPHHAKTPALVSSFDLPFLLAFRQQYPEWPLGYLIRELTHTHIETMHTQGFSILSAEKDSLLTYLKTTPQPQLGFPLLAYTVNERPTAQALFSAGVAAIFSDKADTFG